MQATFTIVKRDRDYHSLYTTATNKIPRTKTLATVGGILGSPGQRGNIILNSSDSKFYGHNGKRWVPFSSSSGGNVWEYSIGTQSGGRDLVRLDNTNPVFSANEDFVVPSSGTESTDPGVTDTRFMFLYNNGSVRGGTVTGTQWDSASRGLSSVAFGTDTVAFGPHSVVSGGDSNLAYTQHGTIAGGFNNELPAVQGNSLGSIGGGQNNKINGKGGAIGGGDGNTIGVNSPNCVVAGGRENSAGKNNSSICGGIFNVAGGLASFVGGGGMTDPLAIAGDGNKATGDYSVVCGGGSNKKGNSNTSSGRNSFIGGGEQNTNNGVYGVVAGGFQNTITTPGVGCGIYSGGINSVLNDTNNNTSTYSAIHGGYAGTIAASNYSTILGGSNCGIKSANYSIIGGRNAQTGSNGCVVLADSNATQLASSGINQFVAGYSGGTTFFSNTLYNVGVNLASGANVWAATSDRNVKENFITLDGKETLAKVDKLPIYQYNFKGVETGAIYRGPVAQEWHELFPSSKDPLRIDTMDLDGISLSAIKGLSALVKDQENKIKTLEERLAILEMK